MPDVSVGHKVNRAYLNTIEVGDFRFLRVRLHQLCSGSIGHGGGTEQEGVGRESRIGNARWVSALNREAL